MRKRRRTQDGDIGAPPKWAITYGDMMSLLLAFFIAVVSFSTIQIEKYRAAMGSFRGALQSPFSLSRTPTNPIGETTPPELQMARATEAVEEIAKQTEMQGIEMQASPEGLRIILTDPVTFDEGSDDLKSEAAAFLAGIARLPVAINAKNVIIEGHTDDTPINTPRFPSNWELSTARSLKVLKLFQAQGLSPARLAAVGYGEFRPRVELPPTASREDKRINRRVEIFIRTGEGNGLFSNIKISHDDKWGD